VSIKEQAKASRAKKKTYVMRLQERVSELEDEIRELKLHVAGETTDTAKLVELWAVPDELMDSASLQVHSTLRKRLKHVTSEQRHAEMKEKITVLQANMMALQDSTIEQMCLVMAAGPCGTRDASVPAGDEAAADGDSHKDHDHGDHFVPGQARPTTAAFMCELNRRLGLDQRQRASVVASRARVSRIMKNLSDDKFVLEQFRTEMDECLRIVENIDADVTKVLNKRQKNKVEDFLLQYVGSDRLPWKAPLWDVNEPRGSPMLPPGAGSSDDVASDARDR